LQEPDSSRSAFAAGRLPAFWFSLLVAAGIAFGRYSGLSAEISLTLFFLLLLFCLLAVLPFLKKLPAIRTILLCLALTAGGTALFSLHRRLAIGPLDNPPPYGVRAGLAGRVVCPTWTSRSFEFGENINFEMAVTALKRPGEDAWRKTDFRVRVTMPVEGGPDVRGFEPVTLTARIEPVSGYANPGGFDWREYQSARGIIAEAEVEKGEDVFLLAQPSRLDYLKSPTLLAGRIRAGVVALHGRLYPDAEVRGVADALLAGDRNRIAAGISEAFTISGTVHVLVVSGLHVGVIALVIFFVLSLFFGRSYLTALATVAGLILFALAAGGRPSVVRAALMGVLAVMALPFQRTRVLFNSISSAFALSLLVQPDWLFDIGFQLSFAAVAGIGVLAPLAEQRIAGAKWWQGTVRRWLVRLVLASVSAQLAITPLVACYFQRVTPVSFPANLVVVPAAMASVTAGFAADVLASVWLPAGKAAALVSSVLIQAMLEAARFFAGFDWSSVEIPSPAVADIFFFWIAVYLAAAWWAGRTAGGYFALACLLWLNVHIWSGAIAGGTGPVLTVRFLDLGRMEVPAAGLADRTILLADPAGRITGAGRTAHEVAVPYILDQGSRKIDCLLLRGRQPSLWSWAWEVLHRVRVGRVIITHREVYGPNCLRLVKYCIAGKIPVMLATAADTLAVENVRIYFLGGGTETPVLPVVEHQGRKFVLAGQLEAAELVRILAGTGPIVCTALEWPAFHPARAGGQAEALAGLISPAAIVCASAADGAVRLARGLKYETGLNGAVSFISSGSGLEVKTAGGGK